MPACLTYLSHLTLPPSIVVKLHALARSLRFALGRKRMPTSIREKSDPVQWDSVSPQRKSYPVVSTRLEIPTIPFLPLKVR